ncbi:NAD(P)/FAD-dependent oxidoreductase [Rubrivivax albus]|uniref:Pyridine nucleotide-disulfide oxidoreductase n=1 Tax=Rubrivivax albus TaxID=2499835 RepID=A0A3S2TMD1_9BURK|nr:FAD-dependent oxidoreductase [Rubrivivax albus]RVT51080.1 pyridine nucleotide-disulfide oxidoreductase [Rubrivivax albus]
MDRVLIVGAGQAAVATAEALRAGGHAGTITLLGDEPHGPYHRPPLSKGWLAGEMQAAQLVMRAPEMLAKKGIVLRTGVSVSAIDRAARCVHLADGTCEPYDALVLATGATPRRLPGFEQAAVLRGRDDAEALAERLRALHAAGRPLTVVGGGFIGLEVAATARKLGLAVTVIEAQPRLLARALPPLLSDWFANLHRSHGVDLRLGASADGVDPGEVLLGIGVVANDALARAAGLACDGGIVIDAHGRTSAPAIVAAGDCTVRRLPDGRLLRLESVQGATEGGKAAAATLLGQDRPFTATPWFWSDQHGRKLQMAGLSAGADRSVLRGVLDAPSFSVWHFAGGRLIAVDSVDDAKAHLLARKLLDAGRSPTPAQAADPAFDLATLLA